MNITKLTLPLHLLNTLLGFFVGGVICLVWLFSFPITLPFDWIDIIQEGSLLVAVTVGFIFINRLNSPILSIGWILFLYALLIEFLDEFTKESVLWNNLIPGLLTLMGLVIISIGFYELIKERKQLFTGKEIAETRTKTILDVIPDLMFHINREGKFLDYKTDISEELFIPAEEIIGSNLIDVMPKEFAEPCMNIIHKTLETGEVELFEYSLPMPHGDQEYQARFAKVSPHEVVAIVRNITKEVRQRKELENKVKELEDTRRAVLNVLEDATIAKTAAIESERKAIAFSEKLSALHEVSQILVSTLDFKEVMKQCVTTAFKFLDVDGVSLYLLDDDKVTLRPAAAEGPNVEEIMALTLKLEEGVSGEVASTGKAEIINHIELTDRGIQIPGTPLEPESLMCAPLKIRDEVKGVITVNRLGEKEFYEDDLEFLKNIANVSIVAIQNAQLYQAIKRSERDYRSLIETAVDPVIVINELSEVQIWNKAATGTFGFSDKEILGKSMELIYPSTEGYVQHKKAIVEFLNTGRSDIIGKTHELPARHKDGHIIDILLSISARKTGGRWLFTALIKDITEIKKARREINRLANFPKENPFPVVEMNSEAEITYMNPAYRFILKKMKLEAKQFDRILPREYKNLVSVCLRTGKDIPAQEVTIGSMVLLWTGHCLENLNLVHLYATDITDLKKTEKELIKAKEQAEISDRLKNVFLSTMSHEVRTPLNVLLGYSDFLISSIEKPVSEDELRDFVRAIQESGNRLKSLIDDILDISHIEADRTVLNLESYSGDDIVKGSVIEIKLAAEKKQIKVLEQYHADNVLIRVDKIRLKQALGNILHNAVKFTHEGSISVNTLKKNGEYRVSITDTGIGIKEDFKPYLFTLFRQEEEGYSRRYEGAGLGLSISQRLVVAMGGRIEVESKLGKGSSFSICLPAEKVSKKKKRRTEKLQDKGRDKPIVSEAESQISTSIDGETGKGDRKILILEDNLANIKYLEFLIKRLGFNFISTDTGEKALELVKSHRVDCMLIDISLAEGMSGIEFMEEVKQQKNFNNVPLIAVTAHAMRGQKREYLRKGFDDYLAKPFTMNDLKEVLNRNLADD